MTYGPGTVTCPRCGEAAIVSHDIIISLLVIYCPFCNYRADGVQYCIHQKWGCQISLEQVLEEALAAGLLRPITDAFRTAYLDFWQNLYSYHHKIDKLLAAYNPDQALSFLKQRNLVANREVVEKLKRSCLAVSDTQAGQILEGRYLTADYGLLIPIYSAIGFVAGLYTIFQNARYISGPHNRLRIFGAANLDSALVKFSSHQHFNRWVFLTSDAELYLRILFNASNYFKEPFPVSLVLPTTFFPKFRKHLTSVNLEKVIFPYRAPVFLNPQVNKTDLQLLSIYDPLVLSLGLAGNRKESLINILGRHLPQAKPWMSFLLEYLKSKKTESYRKLLAKLPLRSQLPFMLLQDYLAVQQTLNEDDFISELACVFDNTLFIVGPYSISQGGRMICTYRPEVLQVIGNRIYVVEVRTKSNVFHLSIPADEFFINLHRAITKRVSGVSKSEISCVTSWRSRLGYLALTFSQPEYIERVPGVTATCIRLSDQCVYRDGRIAPASHALTSYGLPQLVPVKRVNASCGPYILADIFAKLVLGRRICYQDLPVIVPANKETTAIIEYCLHQINAPFPKTGDIYGETNLLTDLQDQIDWPIGIQFTGSLLEFQYLIRRYRNLLVLNPEYSQMIWTEDIAVVDLSSFPMKHFDRFRNVFAYLLLQYYQRNWRWQLPLLLYGSRRALLRHVFYINTIYTERDVQLLNIIRTFVYLGYYGQPQLPAEVVLRILKKYQGVKLSQNELIQRIEALQKSTLWPKTLTFSTTALALREAENAGEIVESKGSLV